MTAAPATAYCGERSIDAFLRSVGKLDPEPVRVKGKGDRWLKEDLDGAIERLAGRVHHIKDAADVL